MSKWLGNEAVNELYRRAIKAWGVQAQVDMLVEELAECTVATQKLFKRDYCEKRRHDLASEVADVKIMLAEIEYILDYTIPYPSDAPQDAKMFATLVQEQMDYKHTRTEERVANVEFKLQNKPENT